MIRLKKESVKTVVMILVKIAILKYFVQNNVELNIKWNMTKNNDMFNALSYPILILVRHQYAHLKAFRPLTP